MKRNKPGRKRPDQRTQPASSPLEGTPLLSLGELPEEWKAPDPQSPRGRIIAAARELFAKQGLEGTSIRDITAAADVNSAMVHYYYRSKEELYRRVLGQEILAVFRTVHAQANMQTSPVELLVNLPTHVMRVVRANPIWASLLSREISGGATYLRKVVADMKDAGPLGFQTRAAALYKQALKQKQVRELPITNVIQFLITLGYSGVFFNPFYHVIGGQDPMEEQAFNERLETFSTLIRHALIPDSHA